ncbi:hypothetical protein DOTSEDRAFT_149838 [Lecanosticta acicola]|uniref:Extracellular membrane protein CFEM domain-containing protein n=1 Tax=Lecanosticta acicola TaxID=111012 RepID=A0AAI8YWM8_9PEZI|nr:hypothetical protein DOTSEDRAFT_149838 [Lecanosticta acicola]
MRSSKSSLLLPVVVSLLAFNVRPASPQNHVNVTEANALAPCVQSCSANILSAYSCDPSQSCFCTDDRLNQALVSCIRANCTAEQGIEAKQYQADTCDYPVRSHVSTGEATLWALFSFAVLFTIFRIVSRCRAFGGAGYWWDDWTLFLALLPTIGVTVTGHLGYESGIGRDYWEVGVDGIMKSLKLLYAGEPLYLAVVYVTKISMVLLYLRIFLTDSRGLRGTCWSAIAVLIVAFVAFAFATIFQCTPVSYTWTALTVNAGQGHCTDRLAQLYTAAAFNIFFDVVVLLLPLPHVIGLRITWLKKVGVMCVLLVGVVVIACSIVRLQYLVRYGNEENVTWNYAYIALWSIIEVYLSIICVCMPATAGLVYRGWKFAHGQEVSTPNKRASFGNQSEKLFGGEAPTGGRLLTTTAQVQRPAANGADLESGNSSDGQNEPGGFYFDGKWFSERRGDVESKDQSERRVSKEHERNAAAAAAAMAASEMPYSEAPQEDLPVNQTDIEEIQENPPEMSEKSLDPEAEYLAAYAHTSDALRSQHRRVSSAKSENPLRSNPVSRSQSKDGKDVGNREHPTDMSEKLGDLEAADMSEKSVDPEAEYYAAYAHTSDALRPQHKRVSSAKSEDPLRSNPVSRSQSHDSKEFGLSPATVQLGAEALHSQAVSPATTTPEPDDNKLKAGATRSASSSLFSSRRPSASYMRSRSASRRPGTPGAVDAGNGLKPARYAHSYVLYNERERPKISPLQPTDNLSGEGDANQQPDKSDTTRSASSSLFSGKRESRPAPTPEQQSLAGSKGADGVPQLRTESEQQLAVEAAKACLGVPEIDPRRSASSGGESYTSESSNPDASPAPLPASSNKPADSASLRSVSTTRSNVSRASQRPRILTNDQISLRSMTSGSARDMQGPLPSEDHYRTRPLPRHPDQPKQSLDSTATQGRSSSSMDSSVLAAVAGKTSMNAMRTQSSQRLPEDSEASHPLQDQTSTEPSSEERYRIETADRHASMLNNMAAKQEVPQDEPSDHRDSNDSAYSSGNSHDEASNTKQQDQMNAQFPRASPSTAGTYTTADEDHPLSANDGFMPYEAGQQDKESTTIKPTAFVVETPRLSYEVRRSLNDVTNDHPSAEQISAVTPAVGWRHHVLENNGYFPSDAKAPTDVSTDNDSPVFKPQHEPFNAAMEAESAWRDFDQGIATNAEVATSPAPKRRMEMLLPSPQQRREERLGHEHGHPQDHDDNQDGSQQNDRRDERHPREDVPPMERGMSLYQNQNGFRCEADASLGPRSRLGFDPVVVSPDNRSQNRSSGGSAEKWGPVRPTMNTSKSESTLRPTSESNHDRDSSHLEEEYQRNAAEGRAALLGKDSRRSGYYVYDPPSAEMVTAVAGPSNESGIDGGVAPGTSSVKLRPVTPPTTAKWYPVQSQQVTRQRSNTFEKLSTPLHETRQKAAERADHPTPRPSTADTSTTAQTGRWDPRQSESDYAFGRQPYSPAVEKRPPFHERRTARQAPPRYDDEGQRVSPVVQQAKQTEIVVNHESPTAIAFSREESEDSTYSSTSISSISSGNETSPSPPPAVRNSDGSATTQSSSGARGVKKKKNGIAAKLAKEMIQRSRDEEGDYEFESLRRPSTADGSPDADEASKSNFSPTGDGGRFSERSLSRLGSRDGFRSRGEGVEIRPRPGITGRELRSSWQG